jgi:hypothetical protein
MSEPLIAIHAMVYKFQKRCWWQLSSLAQQEPWEGNPVPSFKYVISTHSGDPFASEFHDRSARSMPFLVTSEFWDSQAFGERGHVRTRNLRSETSEFILFVDADMVYHKHFMAKLAVAAAKHRGEHKVLAAPRQSMSFEDGYDLVNAASYEGQIPCAWDTAAKKKTWWSAHGRISGAGFFQLVHLPTVREYLMKTWGGIQYVGEHWHRDTNILTAPENKMRSDRNFRLNVGGIIPAPQLGDALHLNHWRHSDPQWKSIPQH